MITGGSGGRWCPSEGCPFCFVVIVSVVVVAFVVAFVVLDYGLTREDWEGGGVPTKGGKGFTFFS